MTIAFAINQNTRATASYMVRIKNHRQVEVKFFLFPLNLGLSSQVFIRSCCGIVYKLIALQTRGRRFDPWHHQSVGYDYKLWPCLHMTLAVGGMLNTNTKFYKSLFCLS